MNAGYVMFLFFNEALFYQVLAFYFRSIKFFLYGSKFNILSPN